MSKSKARFLAELLNDSGRVKKDKSQLTGGDNTIDLDSLPTITNAKLQNSSISIAGHSTALGGSVSLNTGDITEHTDYKYYTDARVRAAVSAGGNLSYNSSTGVFSYTTPTTIASLSNHDTADLAEGTNLYYTDARARSAISVSGNALSYNSSTGVISSSYEESPTFTGNVTISGNLSVTGTTTTIDTANLNVEDKNITLNYSTGDSSANADGAGITIQDAVNSSTNATILWDATNDKFDFSHRINSAGIIVAEASNSPTGTTIGGIRAYGSSSAYMGASDEGGRTAFFGVDASGYAMFGALTNHDAVIRANNSEKLRIQTNGVINIAASGVLAMNSTTVIDSSRNLTNIGTITSGNIGINANASGTYPLYIESGQRYLIGLKNTTGDANYPWLVHDTYNSEAAFRVHFNGVGDRLTLTESGDLIVHNTVLFGHAKLSHSTDYSWRGLTIQNTGDTNECTVDGKSNDGTQQFVVYGGGQSQGFLHPTSYAWRFKVPLTGSLQRDGSHTIWDAGNDGSGSGLDADLLDGVQGASFLRSDATDTATGALTFTGNLNQTSGSFTSSGFTTTNLNTAWQAAGTSKAVGIAPFRYQDSASNKPESGDNAHWGLNIYAHGGASGNYPYGHQLSAASSGNIWQRWFSNGSAGSWRKIWDSGNDGAGTGLDADLLDGQHGSYYTTAANLTGDFPSFVQIGDSSSYGTNSGSWGARLNVTDNVHAKIEVGQDANSMLSHWYAHTGQDSIKFGTATGHDVEFQRNGSTNLEIESGGIKAYNPFRRSDHYIGHLEGSYNNVGANSAKTNPIYTIGSNYNPSNTSVSGMYGIGYAHPNLWGTGSGKNVDWGLYSVAAGTINFIAGLNGTWSYGQFNRNGNTVWDAGNDGAGSGLDADLLDGSQGGAYLKSGAGSSVSNWWIDAARNGSGTSPRFYLSHTGGYGMHINTYNTSGTVYALELHNNSKQLLGVYNNGAIRADGGNTVWHAGNDGASSGLDADTLDGVHGSGYQQQRQVGFYVAGQADRFYKVKIPVSGKGDNIKVFRQYNWTIGGSSSSWNSGSTTHFGALHFQANLLRNDWGGHRSVVHGTLSHNYTIVAARAHMGSGSEHTNFVIYLRGGAGGSGAYYEYCLERGGTTAPTVDYNSYLTAADTEFSHAYANHVINDDLTQIYLSSNKVWHEGNDGSGSGLDADTLDGYNLAENGANTVHKLASNGYSQIQNWQNVAGTGIYSSTTNGAHFTPNTTTTYSTWKSVGARGGYDGILFDSGGDVAIMFDSSGNGGNYKESAGRWHTYWHESNACLAVANSATSSSYSLYVTGAIYATNNIVAYSDRRIKENIVRIDSALEKVNQLEGVYYNRIDDPEKTREMGFIAQEVNEVTPELVTYAEDVDQYGVHYGNTTALLVEAVKELTQQVKDLKLEIEELKNA